MWDALFAFEFVVWAKKLKNIAGEIKKGVGSGLTNPALFFNIKSFRIC